MYGLTREAYDAMLLAQGNRCDICKTVFGEGKVLGPHVDHDHETGAVRALLCFPCNAGGGNYNDDPVRLIQAARFFAKHRGIAFDSLIA